MSPKMPKSITSLLHYEGNAVDLVATINDILETQMTVKK